MQYHTWLSSRSAAASGCALALPASSQFCCLSWPHWQKHFPSALWYLQSPSWLFLGPVSLKLPLRPSRAVGWCACYAVPGQWVYGLTEVTKWNTLCPVHLNVRRSCIWTIPFKLFNFQESIYRECVQFSAWT